MSRRPKSDLLLGNVATLGLGETTSLMSHVFTTKELESDGSNHSTGDTTIQRWRSGAAASYSLLVAQGYVNIVLEWSRSVGGNDTVS